MGGILLSYVKVTHLCVTQSVHAQYMPCEHWVAVIWAVVALTDTSRCKSMLSLNRNRLTYTKVTTRGAMHAGYCCPTLVMICESQRVWEVHPHHLTQWPLLIHATISQAALPHGDC